MSNFRNGGPVKFDGVGFCFFEYLEYRAPRRGEWYLSGAIVEGRRAPNDLSSAYHIVRPTHYAITTQAYKKGNAVRLTNAGLPLPRKVQP